MLMERWDRRILLAGVIAAVLFWCNIGFAVLRPATGSFVLKWIPSALFAFLVFRHHTDRRSFLLFCALLIQSMGAVILDFDRVGYVLYSLGFTAAAHLLFTGTYFPGMAALRRVNLVRWILLAALLVYCAAYGAFIVAHVPSRMLFPVIAYMVVLSAAVGMSLLSGYPVLLMAGMMLFVLDDSVFSWHLFVSPIPANHFITWPSYIAGQTLVTLGFLQGRQASA